MTRFSQARSSLWKEQKLSIVLLQTCNTERSRFIKRDRAGESLGLSEYAGY